jgi:hypothetical protein
MTELPTLVLSEPIETTVRTKDGVTVELVEEITLKRKPNAGDFWDFDPHKITIGAMLGVFGTCSGTPTAVMKKLSYADMMSAQEIVSGFLVSSPKT